MSQPEQPYSIAPLIRSEGERQLETAIAAGAIRCRDCGRVFQSCEEFKHAMDGRVICRHGCTTAGSTAR